MKQPPKKQTAPKPEPEAPQMATLECTLNGQPIPPHLVSLIPYRMTDQGVAKFNEGKVESAARVVSGDFDRIIEQNEHASEPWEFRDARGELDQQYLKPGEKSRLLSERVVTQRGLRGWEPVKKKDGDLVRLGRMFLGKMPEEKAEQRNEHFRREGETNLAAEVGRFRESAARAAREAEAAGSGALTDGSLVEDYRSHVARPTGIQSVRGNSKQLVDRA